MNLIHRAALGLCLLLSAPQAFCQETAHTAQADETLRFSILAFRITGNHLLVEANLQAILQPFIGSGKTLDDLNLARQIILAAYNQAGYELLSVNYNAPASRAGIHQFDVHEVTIGNIRVSGNAAFSGDHVRRQFPSLNAGGTPNLSQLARELFLFNDNPAHTASMTYLPAAQGVSDVEIKLTERSPIHVDLSLNNTGTGNTGASRLGFTLHHDNLFECSHQLTLGVVTSPEKPNRVRQFSAAYEISLPRLGDKLVLSASDSSTNSGLIANQFNISGTGSSVALHYQRTLARDVLRTHQLDIGYDERRYRDIVDFFGVNLGTSVTAKPLTVGYTYRRTLSKHRLALGVTLQHNLSGGSLNDNATYNASRKGATASWQTLQLNGHWQQDTATGWMTALKLNAQHSRTPLIASEQFGLGGIQAVRGFDEREGAGDRGYRTSLELYSPVFAGGQRVLGFIDQGASSRLNPQAGELASQHLASYGLGWRAQLQNGLSLALDGALVSSGSKLHPRGNSRIHLSAVWQF
jgi:hemolysin activation/secretion protein